MADIGVFLHGHPIFLAAIAGILGLVVGSFLNVVIHRVPRMMERDWREQAVSVLDEADLKDCAQKLRSRHAPAPYNLLAPASACPKCGHRIRAIENIPLVSYALLGGRCSQCKTPISPRYPLVELAGGVLAACIAWRYGFTLATAGTLVFVWALIALTVIDIDTQLLPDDITLLLLWTGLLFNLTGTFTPLPEAVMGAAAGYMSLWLVYWLFKIATGKEGMGFGDFKLLAAIGAWVGWKLLPLVILLSSLVGALVGVALILMRRHGRATPIPFGPYLAAAGLIAMLWGNWLNDTYLQLFH
jgi:leader peptidase (prepilin peptidase) / N-methyltransferase